MDSKEEIIYRPYGRALGDCWLVLNYYIGLAGETGQKVRLSDHYFKHGARRESTKLYEILSLLNYRTDIFELCRDDPTETKLFWELLSKYPAVPSFIQWEKNNNKIISYQFDGKSQVRGRFPSAEIEQKILSHAKNLGYKIIRLGLPIPLKECLEILANSELFLAVESGMCNAASACGCPIIFCKNEEPLSKWDILHCNKHFILTNDYIEMINTISNYNKYGLDYYIKNMKNKELCTWLTKLNSH